MLSICPFFPYGEEKPEIKCDQIAAKKPEAKEAYILEFCKGRFKDCAYHFHLSKWLERINDAMTEEEDES